MSTSNIESINRIIMSSLSANATTAYAKNNRFEIAYRKFGSGAPLFLINRFRGVMDTWDPLFLDELATGFELIIFDYPGIGDSNGVLPVHMQEVSQSVIVQADHLGFKQFNILGWSFGGLVAQDIHFRFPDRINKTVLIGTNPPGNNAIPIEPVFFERALKPYNDLEDEMVLFFEPSSESSRLSAIASHERINKRLDRKKIPSDKAVFDRYFAASAEFRIDREGWREKFTTTRTPILVISGDHDISLSVENWFPLIGKSPSLELFVLPDSGHAPQHQEPGRIARHIIDFLLK